MRRLIAIVLPAAAVAWGGGGACGGGGGTAVATDPGADPWADLPASHDAADPGGPADVAAPDDGPVADTPAPDPIADPPSDPAPDHAPDPQPDSQPDPEPDPQPDPASDPAPEAGPPPGCDRAGLDVTSLLIDGIDNREEVAPGKIVTLLTIFRVSAPAGCPGCRVQVLFGVEGEAVGCIDAGAPAACPGATDDAGGITFAAPSVPGTWNVIAYAALAATCGDAYDAFDADPDGRTVVGVLTVTGECAPGQCPGDECPGAECGDIGMECDTWGDGCGRPLSCGPCLFGGSCSAWGRCTGPCQEGLFEVSQPSLNWGGAVASSKPGAPVQVQFEARVGNPDSCVGCARQVVVAIDGKPGPCVEVGAPGKCPDAVAPGVVASVTAPSVPGTFAVEAAATSAPGGCADAPAAIPSAPRVVVGTVKVHGGCDPGTCADASRECGPLDDGCGFELECGTCKPGDLCGPAGACGCSDWDPAEPNGSPGAAFDLGEADDHDDTSLRETDGSLRAGDADWYRLHALDVAFAFLDPYVRVEPVLPVPYRLEVAYVCGGVSGLPAPHEDATCTAAADVDLTAVAGAGAVVKGYRCDSEGGPLVVSIDPGCPGMDGSGDLFVGVTSLAADGACSAYRLTLRL
ncbi:MAG: hypothetical protein FJ087_07380 [Deltaproteobacteria bacterium]|nr:hypothetical protein [Deltaproteobacteria bacterium]